MIVIPTHKIEPLANQNWKFREMATSIRDLLQSDLCIAWRFDKKEGRFGVEAWDGELDETYRKTVFLNPEQITYQYRTIQKAEPIYILDVKNEEIAPDYFYREEAKKRGWTTLICIPLVHNKRIIGFVDSYTYKPFQLLSTELERVIMSSLRAFATQAAESIINIELSNRLQTLQDINQLLTGIFDEQDILNQILVKSLELVGADFGHIYLKDINRKELILKAWRGISDKHLEHTRKLGQGLTGYVAITGIPENIPDVTKEPRHTPIPGVPINSKVAIPLHREEQIIGVLSVKSRFYEGFTDDDMNLLTALATQATIAIERARLNKHLQEVSRLALGADYTALLKYVVNAVQDLTGADVSLLMIGGSEEGRGLYLQILESCGDIGEDYIEDAQVPLDSSISINALALKKKQPIIRPDIQNDFEKPQFYRIEQAIKRGWHGFMAVPLILIEQEDKPLGTLSLYSKEIATFGEPEAQLMQVFANQVAIALQQQQQNHELKVSAEIQKRQASELEALRQTTLKIVAQENLHSLLQAIVEEATKLLKGKGGNLYLPVEGQNKVKLVAAKNVDPTFFSVGATFSSNEGMTGKVLQSKQPLITNNYAKYPDRIEQVAHLFTSMIEVPLLVGNEVIGLLAIFDDEENKFTQQDIPILERLAQQASLAIHNAQLFDRSQKRLQVLDALHKTSLDIVGRLEFDKLMPEIIERAADLVAGSEYHGIGAAYLRCDYEVQKVIIEYSQNPDFKGIELTLNESLVSQVIQTGKAQYMNDFSNWLYRADVFDERDLARFLKNIIEVPVKQDEKVIAIIAISDASGKRRFSEADIELLERFADLIAIAIQQANLFEQIQTQKEAQTQAIHEIANSIPSKKPLNKTLESILDSTLSLMREASLGEIWLLDESSNEIVVEASRGELVNKFRRLPIGKGITGWVAQHKISQLVPDVREDSKYVQFLKDTHSELAVPMLKEGQLIGVLDIEHSELNAFKQEDLKLAEAIAGLAVVAIENNRLFEELDDRATRLERLQKVTTTISAEPSDLEKVLRLIVNSLSQIFSDSPCVIRLYDMKNDEFTHRVAQAKAGPEEQKLGRPRSNGISRYVIKSKSPYYVEDSNYILPIGQPTVRQIIANQVVRAMAALPLKSENDVIGVLYLNLKDPHQFTQNEKQILELFANQAAVAIKNAQLYEQIQAQSEAEIKAIGEIANSIAIDTPIGPDEVLRNIIKSMVPLMGKANLFNVRLLNKKTNGLIHIVSQGEMAEGSPLKIKVGEGVTGWVAQHRKPLLVLDVRQDDRYISGLIEGRSELAVPMLKGDELIGVLNIEHPEIDAFTESDVQLAEAIAGLAVVALENNKLQEAQEKATAADKLAVMGHVTAEFVHRMNNLAGTIPVRVNLAKEYLDHNDVRDTKVIKQLNKIGDDTHLLLQAAQKIKQTNEQREPENIIVNQLLEQAVKIVYNSEPQAEGKIKIERRFAPDLPLLYLDRRHLLDCLISIIRNAIQAMPNSGILSLSTATSTMKGQPCIEITIKDNGVGIPVGNLSKIFKLFFTTKERGLGFGLWRDKTLIKMLAGDINVESKEGIGSTFTINVPVVS